MLWMCDRMISSIDFAVDVQKKLEQGEAVFDGNFFLQPARDFEWDDDSPLDGIRGFLDDHERLVFAFECVGMVVCLSVITCSAFFRLF